MRGKKEERAGRDLVGDGNGDSVFEDTGTCEDVLGSGCSEHGLHT